MAGTRLPPHLSWRGRVFRLRKTARNSARFKSSSATATTTITARGMSIEFIMGLGLQNFECPSAVEVAQQACGGARVLWPAEVTLSAARRQKRRLVCQRSHSLPLLLARGGFAEWPCAKMLQPARNPGAFAAGLSRYHGTDDERFARPLATGRDALSSLRAVLAAPPVAADAGAHSPSRCHKAGRASALLLPGSSTTLATP